MKFTLKVVQTVFVVFGIWIPTQFETKKKYLFKFYLSFSYMWSIGAYIIVQFVELYRVWGNVPLMTATMFLLTTNMSLSFKIFNISWRQQAVKKMIKEFHDELREENRKIGIEVIKSIEDDDKKQLYFYVLLAIFTIAGWILSTEKNQLPLLAWYPYDVTKSPAYELTYAHQCIALIFVATANISCDTLTTSLIAHCRCRLRLLALSLTTLCDGICVTSKGILRDADQELLHTRLKGCVDRHQQCLEQVQLIEEYFSGAILVQFCVSIVIICVSAYQLIFETTGFISIIGMTFYLLAMSYQVFIYCYHGNELVLESINISDAAYDVPWYTFNLELRRSLLMMMTRCRRAAWLTAGGFAQISLSSFVSIIKVSYSFFTVLQQVGN